MFKDKVFLSAEWRKLILANYAVDQKILLPYLPPFTELDDWEGKCYVSLVGFMFLHTKLLGMAVPLHENFEEINLRFYVKYKDGDGFKRGAVFIKEIVPKPAITFVANTIYKENYQTLPTQHQWKVEQDELAVSYSWKNKNWNKLSVVASAQPQAMAVGSEEEFITEHYWGYTKLKAQVTSEYGVEHPRWEVYPVKSHQIEVDFGVNYGAEFAFLSNAEPNSVILAEGSPIRVLKGRKLAG